MSCTIPHTHRLGHQPGRARGDHAVGQAWQGYLGASRRGAATRLATSVACQANSIAATPAVASFVGTFADPAMWTKSTARHLGTWST